MDTSAGKTARLQRWQFKLKCAFSRRYSNNHCKSNGFDSLRKDPIVTQESLTRNESETLLYKDSDSEESSGSFYEPFPRQTFHAHEQAETFHEHEEDKNEVASRESLPEESSSVPTTRSSLSSVLLKGKSLAMNSGTNVKTWSVQAGNAVVSAASKASVTTRASLPSLPGGRNSSLQDELDRFHRQHEEDIGAIAKSGPEDVLLQQDILDQWYDEPEMQDGVWEY